MKNILLIGVGRSSGQLITYLKGNCRAEQWTITVADYSLALVETKIAGLQGFKAVELDVHNDEQLHELISLADIVVSLVPAHLHFLVARACLDLEVNMVTASYVSSEINGLHQEAIDKGVLLLMEMGLDPGIDHMSAKKEIDIIHQKGGVVTSFKSFTGGLVAPESDDNPWNYKFTWNPRNVVLAGQGAVKFMRNGKLKYIPYHNLFKRLEKIEVDGLGVFEGYANRDSLKYRKLYDLEKIPTILRGTLRKEGFCEAWDVFVQLGLTDDTYIVEGIKGVTYRAFLNAYLVYSATETVEQKLSNFFHLDIKENAVLDKLEWLGILSEQAIEMNSGSPAEVLQSLLEQKWQLASDDKDMVVMKHIIEYDLNGLSKKLEASLVIKGDDSINTSMSKTVGLPLGIAVKHVLKGDWKALSGVVIPTEELIYTPVLVELEKYGVCFNVKES